MNNILAYNQYFVKEHVGMFKAANNFDIFDRASNTQILACREGGLIFFAKCYVSPIQRQDSLSNFGRTAKVPPASGQRG